MSNVRNIHLYTQNIRKPTIASQAKYASDRDEKKSYARGIVADDTDIYIYIYIYILFYVVWPIIIDLYSVSAKGRIQPKPVSLITVFLLLQVS